MGFGGIGRTIGSVYGGVVGGIPGTLVGGALGRRFVDKKKQSQPQSTSAPKYPEFAMRKAGSFEKPMKAEQIAGVNVADAFKGVNAAADKRFAQQRERLSGDLNKSREQNFGAIGRRFAAMGGGNSGARLKLEQQAAEANDRQRADAMNELDTTQEMATAERDSQAALTQAGYDQQRNLAQADMNFRNKVFSFERGSKMHELDLAERQQKIDAKTTKFNSEIAAQMARPPKQGIISNLLGDIL